MSTPSEKKKAEHILRRYISRDEDTATKLLALDSKVKSPGRLIASLTGSLSTVIMGAGMSFITVWDNYAAGLPIGITGLLGVISAYPIYRAVTNSRKKSYAPEILRLTDELLKDSGANTTEKEPNT